MSRVKRAFRAAWGFGAKRGRAINAKKGGLQMARYDDQSPWGHVRKGEVVRYTMVNCGAILQPHGERERLRRMTQIGRGQLKQQNGLVS